MDLVSDPLNKRVTKEIRAEMARQGLSQAVLGQELGRNQNYVSVRLTGKKSLTLDELEAIADILRVRVDRLLVFDEPVIPRRRRAS